MEQEQAQEQNKVFVGNLPYSTASEQLREMFGAVEGGEITDAVVITDKMSGRSKGFGFVTFATAEMASKAVEAMNGKEIDGRALTVNIARPMQPRNEQKAEA